MNEFELITALAKAYNKLDYKEIKDLVSENIVYESQRVFSPLFGKNNFLEFLEPKFETIRGYGDILYAEIATIDIEKYSERFNFDNYKDKLCLLLSSNNDEKDEKPGLVFIKEENGLISNISLCPDYPDSSLAKGTGVYPK